MTATATWHEIVSVGGVPVDVAVAVKVHDYDYDYDHDHDHEHEAFGPRLGAVLA